jgi:hypothetical protein
MRYTAQYRTPPSSEETMFGRPSTRAAASGLLVIILGGCLFWVTQNPTVGADIQYNPPFDPTNFVPQVTHKYFTLQPGAKFTYVKKTSKGAERTEVVVLAETKQVMGVTTIVVSDRVWLDDKLKEDTRDWYAQDRDGNVWYFGEAVANYKDGKLVNYSGTWEAGVAGAKPGIVMPASPKVGLTYQQEHAKGKAEDMGTVIALGKKVKVPYGTLDDCLQTRDWSRIEKTANEYKYYCPAVGFVALEVSAWPLASSFWDSKTELISVSRE